MPRYNILCLFLLLLVSCDNDNSIQTIPIAPVSFKFDPSGYDVELNTPLSYKIFTEKDRRLGSDRFGYAGILVVSDAKGILYAFDLCCPHEDSRQVVVIPEYENDMGYNGKVKCASCGSVFVTMFGLGSVESGPAGEPLQRYNILQLTDGSYKIIN